MPRLTVKVPKVIKFFPEDIREDLVAAYCERKRDMQLLDEATHRIHLLLRATPEQVEEVFRARMEIA